MGRKEIKEMMKASLATYTQKTVGNEVEPTQSFDVADLILAQRRAQEHGERVVLGGDEQHVGEGWVLGYREGHHGALEQGLLGLVEDGEAVELEALADFLVDPATVALYDGCVGG